jgi:peptide/nickel transport system ATP-binding protein
MKAHRGNDRDVMRTAQDTSDRTKEDAGPLLRVEGLHTHFVLDEGVVHAVNGVDLVVRRGRTLGVVGESGCGKSVMALSILRLVERPGKIVEGRVILYRDGRDVVLTDLPAEGKALRRIRGAEIAMIFQEPMTSLSPVHTVGSQIAESARLHMGMDRAAAKAHAIETMDLVGIPDAARRYRQYPHEMSGGLRQRAMIAMALSCRPSLLIADEPTTALDVTIQAQILELMRDLQKRLGMSIMLITHNLGVVAETADEVVVMYLGRAVESADTGPIFANPLHPYTQALLRSIPGRQTARKTTLQVIRGSVPDAFTQLPGCPFHPRCAEAVAGTCDRGGPPELCEAAEGHKVACFVREKEMLHG